MGRGGGEQFEKTAPVTGATENEIELAAQSIRIKGGWDWGEEGAEALGDHLFEMATFALSAAVPPGTVIARQGDVLTVEQKAAIKRAVTYMESDTDPYGSNIDLWESDIALFRAIANGGTE